MRIILEVAPEYANEIQNRFDIGEYVDAELREANTYAYPKTFRAHCRFRAVPARTDRRKGLLKTCQFL